MPTLLPRQTSLVEREMIEDLLSGRPVVLNLGSRGLSGSEGLGIAAAIKLRHWSILGVPLGYSFKNESVDTEVWCINQPQFDRGVILSNIEKIRSMTDIERIEAVSVVLVDALRQKQNIHDANSLLQLALRAGATTTIEPIAKGLFEVAIQHGDLLAICDICYDLHQWMRYDTDRFARKARQTGVFDTLYTMIEAMLSVVLESLWQGTQLITKELLKVLSRLERVIPELENDELLSRYISTLHYLADHEEPRVSAAVIGSLVRVEALDNTVVDRAVQTHLQDTEQDDRALRFLRELGRGNAHAIASEKYFWEQVSQLLAKHQALRMSVGVVRSVLNPFHNVAAVILSNPRVKGIVRSALSASARVI